MKNNQVILITGASSGMGKAAALQFIQDGHTVYGAARRIDKMSELVEAGGHALALDVTNKEQVAAGVKQIMDEQGRIDVLINNAGFGLYGAVEDVPLDAARYQFEVNLFGLAQITQEVLPHMRKAGQGKILNVSSMGGRVYTPLGSWYHATKHALEGWSDCLRLELAPHGIDVVIIEPGLIATEFGDVMHEPMMKYSGEGPYSGLAHAIAKSTAAMYEKPNAASPSSVIVRLMSAAIQSSKPKTRYAGGKYAKPMMFIRKYLGDRIFDRIIMSQVK
jgi:NAD(P)-dependent dehydrogenase (short-subunit alcohol dehydrogenase family)